VSRRYWIAACGVVSVVALAMAPAVAQTKCGDAPKEVPLLTQEQLKGDVEGKAQVLTRLLGGAQIKGTIDTSRMELQEAHQNVDQHQIDMYFMWVSCQTINLDQTLSTTDKVRLWTEVHAAFVPSPLTIHSARNPNAMYQYDDLIADVQGAVVSQTDSRVSFQTVRSNGKGDRTREIEYQDWVLNCPDLPRPRPNAFVGQFVGVAVGMSCSIVRKAS
jgi:hypothetical protein